jgi:protein SCO1/2
MAIHKTCLGVSVTIGIIWYSTVAFVFAQSGPPGPPAERMEAPPDDLLEVGVTEHLGEQIPLKLDFENTQNKKVKLQELFDGERPVILTLNYSNCPMLCSLQLTGLFAGLKEMDWAAGDKYRVVSVSIDPAEPTARAALTKRKYLKQYGRAGGQKGVRFLVGDQKNIRALADSVGFRYKYLPEKDEYVHAAATIILTPDGKISRYLYDVEFGPQTLKLSLLEASKGKIGSTMDQVLLFCYQYDAVTGKYAPAATQIMKIAGAFAVLVIGGALLGYWIRESRRSAAKGSVSETEGQPTQAGA